jgi:subtilisin family serine protease/PKD repeat protein
MSGDSAFEFVAPVLAGDDGGPNIVTPDLLVGFEPSVTEQRAEAILAELNAGDIIHRRFGNMKGAYHLRTRLKSGLDVLAVANQLAERPEVRFAEPDVIFTGRADFIPNDPGFTNLWGMQNTGQSGGVAGMDMESPQAWDITTGSSNIIVVIIDVGVQPDHPDIYQIPGTNFTSDASFDGGPVNACDNHGTAVAGCVSATINNSLGTVGIAPGCRSASARVFISNPSCDGSWTTSSSWTVNALAWAQNIGARVSNNSNKYGFHSSAIAAEYAYTRGAGMVHFASVGNDATSSIVYPASLPDVNAVAALDESGSLASFSDYGPGLAFAAPGQDIYTTDRTGADGYGSDDYAFLNGTSFASPYAAGVAALVLSINPSLGATEVERIMQRSCVDLGAPGYDTTYGWGFVNAYNAVMLASTPSTATNITVTSIADSGAGTLRAALASAADGDTIDASGVTGTILLTSGELLVTNSVTILGPGRANLAVNGNHASRVFHIGSAATVTIANLTITNGFASGVFPANEGGGIYNTGPGTLTVSNCTLSGNSAGDTGGGIFNDHSTLTVNTTTLSSNSASFGGAIYNWGNDGSATLTVSNCTLIGNLASNDSGGGIYNDGQSSGNGTVQIVNSTLSGNSAGYGAGIYNDGHSSGSATLTVTSSTLRNNPASGWGGGILNNGTSSGNGTVQIVNSTLSGNSAANSFGGGIFNNGNSGNATLTVSASILSSNSASVSGAGIFNNGNSGNATLTVSTSTLSSNSANFGAGIYNNGNSGKATLTVSASTLSSNLASVSGGGIYNNGESSGTGTVQIATSTLSRNSAQYGGSIYNDGTSSGQAALTVSTSTLSSNSASARGGGIYNDGHAGSATLTVSNSTLSGDSASVNGGGIYNNGHAGSATLTVSASTLSSNSAGANGAGIYNDGEISGTGTVQIATSTLSGNLANANGGGIYNDGQFSGKVMLSVSASTFSGNSAGGGNGSGIYNNGGGGSANVEIGSTILKAGASGGNIANASGTVNSDGYNLASDNGGGFLTGTADQINTDPMLGPLQDNGGPTFTQAPLCGSPAIDKGKNLSASATDQRGSPRTFDDPTVTNATGGDGTDIGAFEVQQPCPVANFIASPTNGTWPLSVSFVDTSTGPLTNRFWVFGDGSTTNTTVTNLSHTYLGAGTNTVSLTVSGPVGPTTLTRTKYIVVTNVPPRLTVSPASLPFGTIITGQSVTQSFQMVNTGGLSLTGSVASTLPFQISGGSPFNVAAGQTGLVQVSFSPISAGSFSNAVVFSSNGGKSTNSVTGSALTPAQLAVSPPSLDFGSVAVGHSAQAGFTVTDLGGAALINGSATVGSGPFSVTSGGVFSLAGFGSTNVVVLFAPGSAGGFTNAVVFTSSGGNHTNMVSGTAFVPVITLSIALSGSNVVLSWPSVDTAGFALEQAGTLVAPASWVTNAASVTNDGTNKSVSLPATNSLQFFRLRKP